MLKQICHPESAPSQSPIGTATIMPNVAVPIGDCHNAKIKIKFNQCVILEKNQKK
ncbi:hypothetical protein KAI52_02075 [Candidatus Parcubacteria bacterium]|nr:hypothetical protein [Candidatus Parcubacteria bacterium]